MVSTHKTYAVAKARAHDPNRRNPPYVGVYADEQLRSAISFVKRSYIETTDSAFRQRTIGQRLGCEDIYAVLGAFDSGDKISFIFAVVTAKETSVGGTSSSPKVPLMLSLPPIEATPSASCASSAPRSAATGAPSFGGGGARLRNTLGKKGKCQETAHRSQ